MNLLDLFQLQGTLFAMMLVGAICKKTGILNENGKQSLTDLCIHVIIPCNIFQSCLLTFSRELFYSCGLLLLTGILMQLLCLLLNRSLFHHYPPQQKKVLQYSTLVPMSGFLGNPIAEGLYDGLGVFYTSIFLIPMRIVMWSVGTSYFIADAKTDKKTIFKNILTHPCLVAVYLGLFCMITQLPLPRLLTDTVHYIGSCNSAMTMLLVGTILTDISWSELLKPDTLAFSVLRLIVLPVFALGIGILLGLDNTALGISVLMSGMPAGATTALFAARYQSDAPFAARCVVDHPCLYAYPSSALLSGHRASVKFCRLIFLTYFSKKAFTPATKPSASLESAASE